MCLKKEGRDCVLRNCAMRSSFSSYHLRTRLCVFAQPISLIPIESYILLLTLLSRNQHPTDAPRTVAQKALDLLGALALVLENPFLGYRFCVASWPPSVAEQIHINIVTLHRLPRIQLLRPVPTLTRARVDQRDEKEVRRAVVTRVSHEDAGNWPFGPYPYALCVT